jgi:putative effector of murein hydrolase LrgA (UPF0299 family)
MIEGLVKYFKSKTVLFGLLLAIAGWVQTVVIGLPLPAEIVGLLGTFVGAAIIWLRSVTSVPLSEK